MSSNTKRNIDLGFVEDCEPALLKNVYFPSKVGGRPAWLDLDAIPSPEELKCKTCETPLSYLCQIYAPIEDDPNCFHRTIYTFICRTSSCFVPNSAENVAIFRSQLPRVNKFYSATAPDDSTILGEITPSCKLCIVCGCRGPFTCSKCKCVNYCSAEHQRSHWPRHKTDCSPNAANISKEPHDPTINFPEFEIVIERDNLPEDGEGCDDEDAEKRRLEDYQKIVEEGKAGTLSDLPESELAKFAKDEQPDIYFKRFKKCIADNPTQVLRYEIGGTPLWITDVKGTIENIDAPPCANCNSKRRFEFQIMPQMINYLKDDSIDWGVLAVYTCEKSCEKENGYATEFVLKQDIVLNENK